jgi:long-chain fatty acid transport protein
MIRRMSWLSLVAVTVIVVVPSVSWSSGFALFEVGGRAGAMSGAMTAVADDPSALFWNPAGMAFQTDDGVQLMFGASGIWPTQTFYGESPYPGEGYTADQVEQTFIIPHVMLGIPVNKRLEVSFSVMAPFGLGTEWDDDFLGRYISKKADLMVIDLGGSMAYQLSDSFAFGIGVDYMMTSIELIKDVGLINPFDQQLTNVAQADLKSTGTNAAWAWNAGILWKLGGGFSLGANYRSDFTVNGNGEGYFTQYSTGYPEFDAAVGALIPFDQDLPLTAEIAFPDFWNVGLAWQNEKWTFSAQYGVMGWSSYQELPITFPENPEFSTVLEEGWEDAAQYRFGMEYRASANWAFQLGALYDETPQPIDVMSPLLADGDRTGYTAGLSYFTSKFRFNLGVEDLDIDTRSTDGTSIDGFNGTYVSDAWLVHTSFLIRF